MADRVRNAVCRGGEEPGLPRGLHPPRTDVLHVLLVANLVHKVIRLLQESVQPRQRHKALNLASQLSP
jgi:hypothetical protein